MGKATKLKRLDYKDRVRLLRSWLHYLYKSTHSWEIDNVGSHIAYLCKAVIDDGQVEWHFNNPVGQLIMKKDPKMQSVIWRYIQLVPNDR